LRSNGIVPKHGTAMPPLFYNFLFKTTFYFQTTQNNKAGMEG